MYLFGEKIMFSTIIGSTVIAALVAGVVSLIVIAIKDRHSKNELYVQTLSAHRMDWLKAMREHIVEFVTLYSTMDISKNGNETENNRIKFERCRANILMRLNPDTNDVDSPNDNLKKVLNDIKIEQQSEKDRHSVIKNIENWGVKLLKDEWERIKIEAGESVKRRKDIDKRTMDVKEYKDSVSDTSV